jgi:hypothetical protein
MPTLKRQAMPLPSASSHWPSSLQPSPAVLFLNSGMDGEDRWKMALLVPESAPSFVVTWTWKWTVRKQEAQVMPILARAIGLSYSKNAKGFVKAPCPGAFCPRGASGPERTTSTARSVRACHPDGRGERRNRRQELPDAVQGDRRPVSRTGRHNARLLRRAGRQDPPRLLLRRRPLDRGSVPAAHRHRQRRAPLWRLDLLEQAGRARPPFPPWSRS